MMKLGRRGMVAGLAGWPLSTRGQLATLGAGGGASGSGPTFDVSLMTVGTLPPGFTFTRASIGTFFNSAGTLQTAAINTPRWDFDPVTLQLRGLLLEDSSTNLLLNSATLSTQSVTVSALVYTLSFQGTGQVVLSGAVTGTLIGTGTAAKVSLTVTATAGSLTLTVTGSVTNAQLEQRPMATSYITTAGASASRSVELLSCPVGSITGFDITKGSLVLDYIFEGSRNLFAPMAELIGSSSSTDYIDVDETSTGSATAPFLSKAVVKAGNTLQGTAFYQGGTIPIPAGVLHRGAVGWALNDFIRAAHDGTPVVSSNNPVAVLPTIVSLTIASVINGQAGPCLWAQRARYWPRELSTTEMVHLTTVP